MKGFVICIAAAVTIAGAGCASKNEPASTALPAATPAAAPATQTYTGELMDSACAAMGSHEAMMQGQHAKDGTQCTLACATGGSKFVLYDPATRSAYQLDDQPRMKSFAGQKVKVTGKLDIATRTIHVQQIGAA